MGKRTTKRKTILGLSTGGFAVICGLCLCVSLVATFTNQLGKTGTATATSIAEVAGSETQPTSKPTVKPSLPSNSITLPTETHTPEPTQAIIVIDTPTATGEQVGTVIRVIDGDTIDVTIDGQEFRVRYIGVNTPESNESCFTEAANANIGLVTGQTVRLVKDVSETDRFGRLLRYVYVGDVFVNAELVRLGYAEAVEYPPDTSQADYLESLEAQARTANLNCYATGVFGGGGGVVVNTPTPPPVLSTQPPTDEPQPTQTPTLQPQPTQPPAQNCDPSYPTVCIPPPPPDLDCGDIPYRDFQVLPPDPHRFDRNNDGIGCES